MTTPLATAAVAPATAGAREAVVAAAMAARHRVATVAEGHVAGTVVAALTAEAATPALEAATTALEVAVHRAAAFSNRASATAVVQKRHDRPI